ncbi:hypothetical protein M0813_28385 [Anaeramoeba flamelloides]|uniref:Uncharacterized protein n=1 Tax=Anaeramoeba flamelloides TaxID=1746091 RepID=A0ABQ8XT98_9EUKA|nr:hypothetical protein M0813_28385 [Anaeramoeba flamelloides]
MSQTNNNSEHHFYPILWNSFEEMNKTVHQSIQHLKEIHSTFQDFGSASQQNSSKLKKLFQSFQQRVEHESQEAACWNGYKFETQTSSEHEKQINKVSKQIYNQIAQFLQTYQTKTTKVIQHLFFFFFFSLFNYFLFLIFCVYPNFSFQITTKCETISSKHLRIIFFLQ